MGPVVWTAERDAKLMVLLLPMISTSGGLYETLAKKWAEQYPDETYQPSIRALTTRFSDLKNKVKGNEAGSKTSVPTTPQTHKTFKVTKTPTSSVKRSSNKMRSTSTKVAGRSAKNIKAEYDSDGILDDLDNVDDSEVDLENFGPLRKTPGRRTKSASVNYLEGEDDVLESDSEVPSSTVKNQSDLKINTTLYNGGIARASSDGFVAEVPTIARSKKAAMKNKSAVVDTGSDISDFNPHA